MVVANMILSHYCKCRRRLLHLPDLHSRDGLTDDEGLAEDTWVYDCGLRCVHTGPGVECVVRDAHLESQAREYMECAVGLDAELGAAGGEFCLSKFDTGRIF